LFLSFVCGIFNPLFAPFVYEISSPVSLDSAQPFVAAVLPEILLQEEKDDENK